ncbi:phospholipase D-like domain-containing protein [Paenibacillus sp. NPDC056579]|uniref:phospholipase D-like domain-containing protein n=1 Tax=Paenibacillus sp. NPDC056579 TaxID=3345871 RepID=UPI0036836178
MWVLWLYLLNTVFMLIVALIEARRPAKSLNWLTICLILPIIGFVLYLITSNPIQIQRKRLTSQNNESDKLPGSFNRSASVIAHALRNLSVQGLRVCQVQVLTNGIETYENLIRSIQNAQKSIDLEYYIFRNDNIGRRITELLIERAESGVKVRFLRDGWGSRKYPRKQLNRMLDAGIECRTIFPLRSPWIFANLTYRDHCKIVIIDGKEAFTGGINVGDEYTGSKPNIGFWRDTHIRIVGESSADLHTIFQVHWNISVAEQTNQQVKKMRMPANRTRPISQTIVSPERSALLTQEWASELGTKGTDEVTLADKRALHHAYVQTFEGNPGIPTPIIREVYFNCLTQAVQSINISTPYFVPDADIIMAIKTAVARGVRVRLLVPRQVELSTMIVGAASRTYYGDLLEAGVHIYQYNKGMLHAKVMIIDGEIATVGSANFDMRSMRLNYEVCDVIYSSDVARKLAEQFEQDLTDSLPLRMEDVLQRSPVQRVLDQGARLLAPLL